jgi:indolepyruvate ferredoxin oxidoreductase beta subunit
MTSAAALRGLSEQELMMTSNQPIKIAILAMGGEGGGVLADWIVSLGEANGCFAQTTSVPGVAQRTGATIYYVELMPGADRPGAKPPVLALMPLPGDVDVVLCSELMEAGRAVQRGLVTPDRTTLVTSTHRVYSIAEKSAMGDGRVDSDVLLQNARGAARKLVAFDMAAAAEQAGSVISAVLFGALCGTGALPFTREQFEATIERGGVGVKPSLKAFASACAQAQVPAADPAAPRPVLKTPELRTPASREVAALLQRIARFVALVQTLLTEGVRRLVDYQDPAYAALDLDRIEALASRCSDDALIGETARHLALWMSYEDTIRVADLKTRAARFERVRKEVRSQTTQILAINEYMHPRIEEICETLPAPLGRWLAKPHALHRLVARFTHKGRVVQTSSLPSFLLLWGLARWRVGRRSTLRYQLEHARIERWLARVNGYAATHPALALEIVKSQRLVKGYGDTHARGLRNYETLMALLDRRGTALAPELLRKLCEAALADEHGEALRDALARLELPPASANSELAVA